MLTKKTDAEPRRNLVLLRAGENSLHNSWVQDIPDSERTWDLAISFFGDDEATLTAPYEYFVAQKGPKFAPLFDLWKSGSLPEFAYIWLPDDDLETTWSDINKMFAQAEEFNMLLCQPSLTEDSFISHIITRRDERVRLRCTNFVELMAPLFSKEGFEKCVPSFENTKTAWGLDFVWPKLLGYPDEQICIFDEVSVKHTRPVARSYNQGEAETEMFATMINYGVNRDIKVTAYLPYPQPETVEPGVQESNEVVQTEADVGAPPPSHADEIKETVELPEPAPAADAPETVEVSSDEAKQG